MWRFMMIGGGGIFFWVVLNYKGPGPPSLFFLTRLGAPGPVPKPRGVVHLRGGEAAAVQTEGHAIEGDGMAFEGEEFGPRGRVPHPRGLVPRRGGEAAAVGTKGRALDSAGMALEDESFTLAVARHKMRKVYPNT